MKETASRNTNNGNNYSGMYGQIYHEITIETDKQIHGLFKWRDYYNENWYLASSDFDAIEEEKISPAGQKMDRRKVASIRSGMSGALGRSAYKYLEETSIYRRNILMGKEAEKNCRILGIDPDVLKQEKEDIFEQIYVSANEYVGFYMGGGNVGWRRRANDQLAQKMQERLNAQKTRERYEAEEREWRQKMNEEIARQKKPEEKRRESVKNSYWENKKIDLLSTEVYQQYRGGGIEQKKPRVKEFDKYVGYFIKAGIVYLEENQGISFTTTEKLKDLEEIAEQWGSLLEVEIRSALERIYMHSGGKNLGHYFDETSIRGIQSNPGGCLGLGLVLTGETTKYLLDSGIARKKYWELVRKFHPDYNREKLRAANEATKRINNIWETFISVGRESVVTKHIKEKIDLTKGLEQF